MSLYLDSNSAGYEISNHGSFFNTYPYTIALWQKHAAGVGQSALWGLGTSNGASQDSLWHFTDTSSGDVVLLIYEDSVGTPNSIILPADLDNDWMFSVVRVLSSSIRYLAVLTKNNLWQGTTTFADVYSPVLDLFHVGQVYYGGAFKNGAIGNDIAEFWYTNTDIFPSIDWYMDKPFVVQLAYGGPFSIPHIAKNLLSYVGFRSNKPNDTTVSVGAGYLTEERFNPKQHIWTPLPFASTIHAHPPLPYWYRKPPNLTKQQSIGIV